MKRFKPFLSNRAFLISIGISLLLLFGSLFINYAAGMYATEKASNSVTDIILNNIRVYDVDGIFIYGPLVFWFFVSIILILDPGKIPFTIKSIALFIVIRSIFISLTHIGPFPVQIPLSSDNPLYGLIFDGDLFFSGHTGFPFLLTLLFWENKKLRYLFLITSVIFAIVVLLGHYHYSIDVLAAFFITYAIADIARFLFKKDLEIFKNGL